MTNRLVVMISVMALALSSSTAHSQQQPRSGQAMPFASKGNCPSGYITVPGFARP
jgi:hypothetical protein